MQKKYQVLNNVGSFLSLCLHENKIILKCCYYVNYVCTLLF